MSVPPPVPPPRGRGAVWALAAALAAGGGALVWMAVSSGGDEEMREGTVTIETIDEGEPPATEPDGTTASTPAPSTTAAATTTLPATTDAPTTVVTTTTTLPPTTTTPPPTSPPTTAPGTLPTTVPPVTTVVPATTAPPVTSPPPVVLTGRCESTEYGWDVGIPEGWFTADETEPAWACSAFDRAPVVIGEDELYAPVIFSFIEVHYADVIAGYYEGEWAQVVLDTPAMVGFYDAARIEWVSTGLSEIPAGTPGIAYIIDRGGWSTVLLEGYAWSDDYAEIVAVLDAMAADIAFWDS